MKYFRLVYITLAIILFAWPFTILGFIWEFICIGFMSGRQITINEVIKVGETLDELDKKHN